jgi:hypothetical protein
VRAISGKGLAFADQVDSWVQDAVRAGACRFDDLLRALPGVYPVDAAASVRRLRAAGRLREPEASWLLAGASPPGAAAVRPSSLPAPHPLDYDWRFTHPTSAEMLDRAMRVAFPGDDVICLGTPSVFLEAVGRGAGRRAALVDSNPAVTAHFLRLGPWLRVWNADLLSDPIPAVRSSAVVADPPWYWPEMAGFLWSASNICTPGGHVFMSLPPRRTRPAAASEVGRLLGLASDLGFELASFENGVVQYESPPFERNALRAVGVGLVSYDWRRGDLCVLRLRSADARPRPTAARTGGRWAEEALFEARLRLRSRRGGEFADPTLTPLVAGDVLPSVSRRHPLRDAADVWTAGNRVFGCAGTGVLRQIIRSLGRGGDPARRVAAVLERGLTARERYLVGVAAEQVVALATLESRDRRLAGVG